MQWLYLVAAILGTILPLRFFVPFVLANGLDLNLFFQQLFHNNVSAFFGVDVIVSSLALWLFVFSEGRRKQMGKLWVYVICGGSLSGATTVSVFPGTEASGELRTGSKLTAKDLALDKNNRQVLGDLAVGCCLSEP